MATKKLTAPKYLLSTLEDIWNNNYNLLFDTPEEARAFCDEELDYVGYDYFVFEVKPIKKISGAPQIVDVDSSFEWKDD